MNQSKEWCSLSEEAQDKIVKHQSEFPVKVGAIAKEFGITVKKSTLNAGFSGEIKKQGGNEVIIRVNRHDVKERQRFTLAHEIAHFLLHEDRIGDGIIDDILYRSNLSDVMEAQANRLAADIVMPLVLIKKSLEEMNGLKIEQKIEKLAKQAELSTTAIKIRLERI